MSNAKQIIWRNPATTFGSSPLRGRVGSVSQTRLLFSIHWGITRGQNYTVRTALPAPPGQPALNGQSFETSEEAQDACQAFLEAFVAEVTEV